MANNTKTFPIRKRKGSPDFVFGSFGFKPEEIEAYKNANGYVNFDILEAKTNDGYYIKVSDYGVTIGNEETPFQ